MDRDYSFGGLLYRLIHDRDPPWDNPAAEGTVGRTTYRRPTMIIEWTRALIPLRIFWCRCGRVREVSWSRGYVARRLWPKNAVMYVGLCVECGEVASFAPMVG